MQKCVSRSSLYHILIVIKLIGNATFTLCPYSLHTYISQQTHIELQFICKHQSLGQFSKPTIMSIEK